LALRNQITLWQNKLLNKRNLIPVITVFAFFFIFILIGLFIYKDYGVSGDEQIDYVRGQINYNRFSGGSLAEFQQGCQYHDTICYYPPFFSMLLYWYAPTGDSQAIYWRRHQLTFAFFVLAVFIFFLVGKKIFKDWKMGLLGTMFLIISPRIFAHSFYNPKDIPCLGAYVIAMYTLLWLLEKKNVLTALLHGLATGVLCSIRTPGLIMIPITFFFYFFDLFLSKAGWRSYLKAGALLITSMIAAAALVYWLTPMLYTDPIANYIKTFNIMQRYPWNGNQFYLGQNVQGTVPWHYPLVWFAISSPVGYQVLFGLGAVVLLARTIQAKTRQHFQSLRDFYLAGACGVLPLAIVILMKSTLYNGDRQLFFVYPGLLLVALFGFQFLIEKIRQKTLHWRSVAAILLIASLASPLYFMVRYHPYEYLYFNFLAGSKMSIIKDRFGFDAWGVSIMDGLKYIARTDPGKHISVSVPGAFNSGWYLLSPTDRDRLNLTTDLPPDYVIITYGNPTVIAPEGKLVYSIRVGDADILSVYKMDVKLEKVNSP
jgi:hypothetical protein